MLTRAILVPLRIPTNEAFSSQLSVQPVILMVRNKELL